MLCWVAKSKLELDLIPVAAFDYVKCYKLLSFLRGATVGLVLPCFFTLAESWQNLLADSVFSTLFLLVDLEVDFLFFDFFYLSSAKLSSLEYLLPFGPR